MATAELLRLIADSRLASEKMKILRAIIAHTPAGLPDYVRLDDKFCL